MERKRKHDSESTEALEPAQKQHQKQEVGAEQEHAPIGDKDDDGVEHEGFNEEHEEEEEDEDEESENETEVPLGTASQGASEDDEPIQNILEPFGKEQLMSLLMKAAEKHRDVADRIRRFADEDPIQRKIFVHGFGWDTTTETLVEAFTQYGAIEDCKAVVDKISGKSKGYGFILFKSRTGARNALKEPQKKIGNRLAACQLASVGPVQNAPATSGPAQQPASEFTQRKIFVSNVGAELDPKKLYAFFSKYGEIEEGPLGLDRVTRKPKGFCLFVYKTAESAKKVLEEPHKNFEGHVLNCQKAVDGPKHNKQNHQNTRSNHNPRHQRNNNSGGYNNHPGHLMAPTHPGVGGAPAAQALNPALGQAITALLGTQGSGLGLNPAFGHALFGTLGSAASVNPAAAGGGFTAGYVSQANYTPGTMPGYGTQGGSQTGYLAQQPAQGGAGRGQSGVGQYGQPYMGL